MERLLFQITVDELERIVQRACKAAVEQYRDSLKTPVLEVMTKAELADYLRCSVSKVNSYMGKGLPFFMFGEHPRYRKSDIDRWLKSEHLQEIQRQTAEVV
jgi:excisionase family DNA binding protein